MAAKFDLLGDPIPENHGKPGANGHVPTAENARKIRVLLIADLPVSRIAQELGISVPTLRKHYFQNGKVNRRHAKSMALSEAKARNLLQLDAQAEKGNVSAMKDMRRIIEREEMLATDREISDARPADEKPATPSVGKKDAARAAALEAEEELSTLFNGEQRLN